MMVSEQFCVLFHLTTELGPHFGSVFTSKWPYCGKFGPKTAVDGGVTELPNKFGGDGENFCKGDYFIYVTGLSVCCDNGIGWL